MLYGYRVSCLKDCQRCFKEKFSQDNLLVKTIIDNGNIDEYLKIYFVWLRFSYI